MNPTPASRAPRTGGLFGTFTRACREHASLALVLGASAVLWATGCGKSANTPASATPPGTILVNPLNGLQLVVDPNQGGQANKIKLVTSFWGRLVDIYDFDALSGLSTLQFKDYVIGDNIASDLLDYRLDRNSITETETLTILHVAGSPGFVNAFNQIELNVQPLLKKGLNDLPPFTAMPRNAALVLVFDDLLDPATITPKNVAVLTGYPPVQPYEARLVPDPSHGDLLDRDGDGVAEFYSTRVLIDTTVSQIEAQQSPLPLPINSLGLPEAQVLDQPNVVVRMPTKVVPGIGQLTILSNLSGSGMLFGANGPNDPTSATQDVLRALRSSSGDIGDPNNGFLIDQIAPQLIGVQGVQLLSVTPAGGSNYLVDASFDAAVCAPQPQVGDVIRIGNTALAVVTQNGSAPSGGIVTGVLVDLQVGSAATFLPGQAQYLLPYDPTTGVPAPCFVRFSPTPLALPNSGIAPNTTITVRFSEPMDPASISGFESFFVTRVSNANGNNPLGNTIVATAQPSLDLKEFTYTPTLPLEHDPVFFPQGEDYMLTLLSGPGGPIDLSGKPLQDSLPPFNFTLNGGAGQVNTRGVVFKFNSPDEDGNGFPELRGQYFYNLTKGTIRPRPVTRFAAVIDQNQPVIGLQTPFTAPIQTPLSNLGSKMMTVWRYHDMGLGLMDDSTMNLDLEHLAWAPFLGLQVDGFDRFRIATSHSKFMPDEVINPMSLLPNFPNSGLVKTFDSNQLDVGTDPLKVVHPKDLGYFVQPVDAFTASTGTLMMPYPLNRNISSSQFTRYTFRDTGLLAVGGPSGAGVETAINSFALGVTLPIIYPVNKVPTIGLPLLMEFRCYPDDSAFGLNGFKVNIALTSSARPAFRAFSTGGVLSTGALFKIDPDNEPQARGGINPGTGQPTGPGTEIDPVVYLGQADFVVRVNRVHTIWMDTLVFTARYQLPVTEPPVALQPLGTSVVVALRGAGGLSNGQPLTPVPPAKNAQNYDPYGDPLPTVVLPGVTTNFLPTFPLLPGGGPDKTWKTNMSLLNDLRFFQARITMLSNPDTLLIPELSGMGIALSY